MIRISGVTLALVLAAASAAQAASPPSGAPVQTVVAQQQDFQAEAEKACNAELDKSQFDYNTMDECIADTSAKMQRQAAQHASAASDPKATRPN